MCDHIHFTDDGTTAIICGMRRRQHCACGRAADFLCHWKVATRQSGTCDKPICSVHAQQVAPGKHLCQTHQKQFEAWKARHPDFDLRRGEQQELFQEVR